MNFTVYKPEENIESTGRRIGYIFQKSVDFDKFAFVRELARGGYPRFHLYITAKEDKLLFSLHLDQKRPTYGKHTAHSGEYDGALVEEEARRIKSVIIGS